jgi:hypothetical protein
MVDVKITVRDGALPDDATVLLHMGESRRRSVATKVGNIVKQHDRWMGVFDEHGRFAVSAYALDGIDEELVLREMPHPRFGRSTVGRVVNEGFELLPTSVDLRFMQPRVRQLQAHHYSIMLPVPGSTMRFLDEDIDVVALELRHELEVELRRLLDLFAPVLRDPGDVGSVR